MTIATLVRQSEVIAVVRVTSVFIAGNGQRQARGTVEALWKGARQNEIEFLCSPTWTCDIADAKEDERVVLFLVREKKSPIYRISNSGRGRFPIHTKAGRTFAAYWRDVIFPAHVESKSRADPAYGWIRLIELTTLRQLVAAMITENV